MRRHVLKWSYFALPTVSVLTAAVLTAAADGRDPVKITNGSGNDVIPA